MLSDIFMHQIVLFFFLAFVSIHANLKIITLLITFVITPYIVTNRTEERIREVRHMVLYIHFYSSSHKEIHHAARTSGT